MPTLLLALFVFLTAAVLPAQVVPVTRSGCPDAPAPAVRGEPRIGERFAVVAPPCRSALGHEFVLLGVPARPLNLGALGCARQCLLAVRPFDLFRDAWIVTIPRDRSLVGTTMRAQAGCVEIARRNACIRLSIALDVTVMRP